MRVLKILIRLLCIILFIIAIPLIPLQLLYMGIRWAFDGGYVIVNPLPFAVVDWIDTWCEKHGIDLMAKR